MSIRRAVGSRNVCRSSATCRASLLHLQGPPPFVARFLAQPAVLTHSSSSAAFGPSPRPPLEPLQRLYGHCSPCQNATLGCRPQRDNAPICAAGLCCQCPSDPRSADGDISPTGPPKRWCCSWGLGGRRHTCRGFLLLLGVRPRWQQRLLCTRLCCRPWPPAEQILRKLSHGRVRSADHSRDYPAAWLSGEGEVRKRFEPLLLAPWVPPRQLHRTMQGPELASLRAGRAT